MLAGGKSEQANLFPGSQKGGTRFCPLRTPALSVPHEPGRAEGLPLAWHDEEGSEGPEISQKASLACERVIASSAGSVPTSASFRAEKTAILRGSAEKEAQPKKRSS